MSETRALTLSDVCRSFGPVQVLHDINLTLRPGEVHALIGENGAGKSTAMKIMSGDAGRDAQAAGTAELHGVT